MRLYAVKINLSGDIDENVEKNIGRKICEELADILNCKYGVLQKIVHTQKNRDNFLFATSDNVSWMNELLCETKKILQECEINFSYALSLTDDISFVQQSAESEIRDAIDYISSFVDMDSHLAEDEYIVTELQYVHAVEDILCNVTLKAEKLNKMRVVLTIGLDEEELDQIDKIISWLDGEYNTIARAIDNITKEKE